MVLYIILIIESAIAAFGFGYLLFSQPYEFTDYHPNDCHHSLISVMEKSYDESWHRISYNSEEVLSYYDSIYFLNGLLCYKYKYVNLQRHIFHPFFFIGIPHILMCWFILDTTGSTVPTPISIIWFIIALISFWVGRSFTPFNHETHYDTLKEAAIETASCHDFEDNDISDLFIMNEIKQGYSSYLDSFLLDMKIHKYCMIYVPVAYFFIIILNGAIWHFCK